LARTPAPLSPEVARLEASLTGSRLGRAILKLPGLRTLVGYAHGTPIPGHEWSMSLGQILSLEDFARDVLATAHESPVPTLVLVPDADPVASTKVTGAFAERAGGAVRTVVVPRARHELADPRRTDDAEVVQRAIDKVAEHLMAG